MNLRFPLRAAFWPWTCSRPPGARERSKSDFGASCRRLNSNLPVVTGSCVATAIRSARRVSLLPHAPGFYRKRPCLTGCVTIDDERVRRELLCGCPGFGYKTASWLLRNLGLGRGLAIIDVHVLRALADERRLVDVRLPRDYARVEAGVSFVV